MDLGEFEQEKLGSGTVDIVVVIPVFRHSVFVADAVASALAQGTARAYRILIVDDGCPHAETRRIAITLATAYSERVEYTRRINGGLSAARNTGIDYALSRWPSVRAIQFLDADNQIEPMALDRAFTLLMSDPKIGWVYPDIAMFGSIDSYFDYSGPYSILRHLACNLSEAGSMVRREVFEHGCRFDELMRLGYEDWEFWWQCIEAGFTGRHVPFFGLRYRKRPESMLSETERERASVLSYMRRKHHALLAPRSLLAFEALEAPRYAILRAGQAKICSDIRQPGGEIRVAELIHRIEAAYRQPHLHAAPRLIVATSDAVLQLLASMRLDRFVFWWLEQQLSMDRSIHVAAVQIVAMPSTETVTVNRLEHPYWPVLAGGVHLITLSQSVLHSCLKDPQTNWIRSLLTASPEPVTSILRIELPPRLLADPEFPGVSYEFPDVTYGWFDFFQQLHTSVQRPTISFAPAKVRTITPYAEAGDVLTELLESGPLLPVALNSSRDIAFVLPIVAYGGVEKVALHIAEQFRKRGWRCHLVVLAKEAMLSKEWRATFDSIAFFHDNALYEWSEARQYLGTTYPKWVTDGDNRSLEGLLLPMNAVVNFHSGALHGIVSKLRRKGVATAASLHLTDVSIFGREVGHPMLSFGYEHVYDLFVPCSRSLLQWCHALGIPRDKLVVVPNAPAIELTSAEIGGVLARRASRNSRPLRLNVLFLGRLDRQKGLDRLAAIINRSRDVGLSINWRIVGSAVVEPADDGLLREVVHLIEPPVHRQADLAKLYEWADVLLVPSHWEGLPLTILEAAQFGVVPVAAGVGAIEEVVVDRETGFILEDAPCDEFAAGAVRVLAELAEDPSLLARLSRQAGEAMDRTWEAGCREFIERIEAVVAKNAVGVPATGLYADPSEPSGHPQSSSASSSAANHKEE